MQSSETYYPIAISLSCVIMFIEELCVVKLGFINDSMQTNYNRPVAAAKATYIECACCVEI